MRQPRALLLATERKDKDLIFFFEHVFISLADCRLKSHAEALSKDIGKCKCIQMQSGGVFLYIMWPWHALGAISYHFLGLKQENSSFVLCILGIIYLFLSEWEEIPFLAPAHKFQSKLQEQERRLLYMAGCRGILFTLLGVWVIWKFSSRIILLVYIHIQLGMWDASAYVCHTCQRIYIKLYLFCWDSSRCTPEQSANLNSISHGSRRAALIYMAGKYAAVSFVFKPKSTLL